MARLRHRDVRVTPKSEGDGPVGGRWYGWECPNTRVTLSDGKSIPPGPPDTITRRPSASLTIACSFPLVKVKRFVSSTRSATCSPRAMARSICIGAELCPMPVARRMPVPLGDWRTKLFPATAMSSNRPATRTTSLAVLPPMRATLADIFNAAAAPSPMNGAAVAAIPAVANARSVFVDFPKGSSAAVYAQSIASGTIPRNGTAPATERVP